MYDGPQFTTGENTMLEQTSKCYDAKLTYTSHVARIAKAVVERTGPDARLPLDRIPLRITDGSAK